MTSNIVLQEVLHVPSFKHNLVSVHSLVTSMKCTVLFTSAFCVLHNPLVEKPQVLGNNRGGLYFVCSNFLKN